MRNPISSHKSFFTFFGERPMRIGQLSHHTHKSTHGGITRKEKNKNTRTDATFLLVLRQVFKKKTLNRDTTAHKKFSNIPVEKHQKINFKENTTTELSSRLLKTSLFHK